MWPAWPIPISSHGWVKFLMDGHAKPQNAGTVAMPVELLHAWLGVAFVATWAMIGQVTMERN
ncbi:hypothetical protein C5Y97_28705 [Blastopirellula marina]|uniref:Uncharacterized protein n=1 Tax=Blastopirellula marina TaxID=124 RepID=A0A2S8F4Y3_9BACT|nr:hypothetical protein C5Y98_28690 [Blastopirellula marina]PTL41364.1 hypothetical protein C5Y97_28705 [Blastopirellula marina]